MHEDLFDEDPEDTPKDRGSDKRRQFIPYEQYKHLTEGKVKPGEVNNKGERYGEWDPER